MARNSRATRSNTGCATNPRNKGCSGWSQSSTALKKRSMLGAPLARDFSNRLWPQTHVGASPVRQDDVRRLFANHEDRQHDEEPRDVRKGGGIHHPQVLDPADAEIAVQHRILVLADLARPASVMAP